MILPFFVSLLAVATFGLGLWRSGVVTVGRKAISTAFSGIATITDSALDDDEKETAVRRAAFSLLSAALSIAVRFTIILALTAVPILLADFVGISSVEAVISLMMRLDYILIVSVFAIALAEVLRRRAARKADTRKSDEASVNSYSDVEQFLHGIAFSSPANQRRVSRLEDLVMGKPRVDPAPPIFVTSLARGGTTALLNALTQIPGIATHTYRDMPFLTAPVLWNRLAGGAKRSVAARDRAHADGLKIDLDSPEAFEEAIWKMHWPKKYGVDGIALWTEADRDVDADKFLSSHMAKIIRARFGQNPPQPVRYCSKNNANIGRLAYLADAFPGSKIVIPLRQPARHAESLHRQHQNFLALQKSDDFVRNYMSDIGHFEFGQIYNPLRFSGFEPSRYDPQSPDHWLDYWISAFESIEDRLAAGQDLILVKQDSMRAHPQDTMVKLADKLDLSVTNQNFEKTFRSSPDTGNDEVFCPILLKKSQNLYARLSTHAL